jgi:broad specificity phosphatase PhoE
MNDAMAVFSSPLQRTRETAGFILGELNEHRAAMGQAPLEIQTDERLLEIKNHFRGKNMTQQAILPQNWRYFMNLRHPSYGESYQSVAERMASFLDEKVEAFAGQTVIAVSHEGPIWALRCLLVNGAPQHWVWDRKAPLASITSISVDAVTHQVVSIRYADPAKNVRIEMSGDVK